MIFIADLCQVFCRFGSMIVDYNSSYLNALLDLFDGNIPEYFDSTEKAPFKAFLEKEPANYFVLLNENKVVGAGGYAYESETEGRIVWLLIDRNKHGKGFGKQLMNHFESEIKKNDAVNLISLMTSQLTDKFYEKLNYRTTRTENDYWVKGMHLYYMEKQL